MKFDMTYERNDDAERYDRKDLLNYGEMVLKQMGERGKYEDDISYLRAVENEYYDTNQVIINGVNYPVEENSEKIQEVKKVKKTFTERLKEIFAIK